MATDEAGRVLVRYLLDEDFRVQMDAEPEQALSEFDLTDEERAALISRDERVLGLIGAAVQASPRDPSVAPLPETPGEVATVTPTEITLPEVTFYLRLEPRTSRDQAGQLRVQYLTRIYPSPPDTNVPLPGGPGIPEEDDPELQLPGTTFHIRFAPQVYRKGDALDLHYRGSFHTMGQEAPPPSRSTLASPRGHDIETTAVRTAAEAVHAAEPEDRYEAILELISAMKGG
ncbi:MAG: hypothetical protein JRJ84_18675 [Deltaproteobacteria bacterium]|nr:hypothetical protein [Deltaproteobacteria bacterium]